MNEFQKGIIRPILESQLAIEKAALEAIKSTGTGDVRYYLIISHEAKITEIKKQLDSLNSNV